MNSTNDTAQGGEFPDENGPNPNDFIPSSDDFVPTDVNQNQFGGEEDEAAFDAENHIPEYAHVENGESNHLNAITDTDISANYANKNDGDGNVQVNDGQEIGETVEKIDKGDMTSTVDKMNNEDDQDINEISNRADADRRHDNFNMQ